MPWFAIVVPATQAEPAFAAMSTDWLAPAPRCDTRYAPVLMIPCVMNEPSPLRMSIAAYPGEAPVPP